MANAFDQFDSSAANAFDQFDAAPLVDKTPSNAEQSNSSFNKGSIGSRAEDIASGVNRFFTTVLPGLPVDTITNVVDLLKAGAGTVYHATTGNPIPAALELTDRSKIPLSSQSNQEFLDKHFPTIGENNRPVNTDATARVLHGIGIGAGGAIAGTGLSGGSIPAAANNALLSIAPSTAQAVTAEKYPDSPLAQLAAGVGASALQGGIRYGAPELTKQMLRGGEEGRQNAQATIAQFAQAGEVPTVGQATQSRTYQGAENMLARIPGGAGPIITKAENLSENLGNKVNEIADNLAPSATPEQAGRMIYKGITGDNSTNPDEAFIPRVRAVQKALYDKLDEHIDPKAPVSATNTIAALAKLTAPIEGAPNLSGTPLMKNATLQAVNDAVNTDLGNVPGKYTTDPRGSVTYRGVNNAPPVIGNSFDPGKVHGTVANPVLGDAVTTAGTRYMQPGGNPGDGVNSSYAPEQELPYQAIKEMRTRVGQKLADVDLSPDVSKTQLNQLYGALSDDMKQAATDAGPEASKAFEEANSYTREMHDKIDLLQSVIDKKGGPEKIFNAATSGTKDGATVFGEVMRSLPDDGKKMLSSAILRRMGKALPGQQDDTGEIFSTNRFLTQWNTMSPEAKQVAFGGYGSDFSKNMDAIAGIASNLRQGSKVFANPSGTAQALTQQTAIAGILGSLSGGIVTGHPIAGAATAAAGIASIGAANLAARALTSPGVVKWMVKATALPANQLDAQIRLLAFTGQAQHNQDMIDVAKALEQRKQPNGSSTQ